MLKKFTLIGMLFHLENDGSSFGFSIKKFFCISAISLFIYLLLIDYSSINANISNKNIVLTNNEREWLNKNPDKLILYYKTDHYPIEFESERGEFKGLSADIISEIEKQLGILFRKIPVTDMNRHLAALKKGECAIIPSASITRNRVDYLFFTRTYFTAPVVIITSGNTPGKIGINGLIGMKVGVVSGYAAEAYLKEKSKGLIRIVGVNNVQEGLRKAFTREIDAFVESVGIASYYIEKEGIPNLRIAGETGYNYELCIGISQKYPLLYTSISKAFNTISEDKLKELHKKWISTNIDNWFDPATFRNLKIISLFIILLIFGLVIISFILKKKLNRELDRVRLIQHNLSEKTDLLQMIVEATPLGIWDFHPLKGIGFLNDQWFKMFGYMPETAEIKLDEWEKYIHPDDAQSSRNDFMTYLSSRGKSLYESRFRIKKADGTFCWVLARGKIINWDENGKPERIIGIHININDLKIAEENLRQSEERFRALFMKSPIPLVNIAIDGKLIAMNECFTELLGYTTDDLPDIDHWWSVVYPDQEYSKKVKSGWEKLTRQALTDSMDVDRKDIEYNLTCKDGTVKTMLIGTSIISGTILSGFLDVTDRRRADEDKQRLQDQLFQSQKLESIGILAGGIAHDFNNMLGIIIGYAELALSSLDKADPLYENFEKICDAAKKSANLTRQLLAFARKQSVSLETFDINKLIESILKMLYRLIGENIKLVWAPAPASCMVQIDRSQFEQVLMNLCVNAKDAIKDVGMISIRTELVYFDETYCLSHSESVPGSYILLSVGDTGSGMDVETRKHMFDPFYTTKGIGKGTGLGLSTVYGIVKQNKGFINVYSELGKGTVFKIYFPKFVGELEGYNIDLAETIPKGNGEIILIIEDDSNHLDMACKMLTNLGYEAVPANSPSSAIEILKENKNIAMFITDVIMPEMNGRELSNRLLEIRPDMKFIFMSGYTPDVISSKNLLNENVNLIQKPFSIRDLAEKIRKILN
jgi:PAS domain S-box-containing protein